MKRDEYYMTRAIRLAEKACGMTSPNPLVGCVIVKNEKIIGEGYHKKAGAAHAEAGALRKAKAKAEGAAMFVTLEPCDNYGRTPPCTDAIIRSGVKRVVIAADDPNPKNNGRGIRKLKSNGISVTTGICRSKAMEINRPYNKFITTGLPFVTLKIAESLDGKIATKSGQSKWISNESSRNYVQFLRSRADAVMVGINTVLNDDPTLLLRGYSGRNPARVIADTRLRIPLRSRIIRTVSLAPVIILTADVPPKKKKQILQNLGIKLIESKTLEGRINLKKALKELGRNNIVNLLVEGGAELAGSFCDSGLVDKILFFIAPKIIGGRGALTSIRGEGINKIHQAIKLSNIKIKRFNEDIMVSGDVDKSAN